MCRPTVDAIGQQAIKAEILAVYDAISAAFAKIDYDAVLEHFADKDMVKISNGLLTRGKEQLRDSWRQRLAGITELRIRMENVQVHVIDQQHAWVTADEYIKVDGQERKAIVSNVFCRQATGWKIQLDHTTYVED